MAASDDKPRDELLDQAIAGVRDEDPDDQTVERVLGSLNQRIRRQLAETGSSDPSEPNAATRCASPSFLRRHGTKLTLAVAASIAVAIISTVTFDRESPAATATYAQAVSALKGAPSLYVRYYGTVSGADGKREIKLRSETWYSGKGVARTRLPPGRLPGEQIEIQTIDWWWQVYPDQRLVVRRAALSRPAYLLESLTLEMFLEHVDRAERVESADEVVNGVKCRLFVATPHSATTQPHRSPEELLKEHGQVYLWVDDRGAVHRSDRRRLKEGQWVVSVRTEVEYGIAIDPELLSTRFPEDYRVVDLDRELERMFDLEKADDILETNGMIVAFHDSRRIDDATLATTMTIRPTDESRKYLLPRNQGSGMGSSLGPGEFGLRSGSLPFEVTFLASAMDRWMRIQWLVLHSTDERAAQLGAIKFSYVVYARDEALLEIAGIERSSGPKEHTLKIPAGPAVSVSEVAGKVYDQMEQLAQYQPQLLFTRFRDRLSRGRWRGNAVQHFKLRVSRKDFRNDLVRYFGAPASQPAAVASTQASTYPAP